MFSQVDHKNAKPKHFMLTKDDILLLILHEQFNQNSHKFTTTFMEIYHNSPLKFCEMSSMGLQIPKQNEYQELSTHNSNPLIVPIPAVTILLSRPSLSLSLVASICEVIVRSPSLRNGTTRVGLSHPFFARET